jgi:transcriptional regulator with XRE-family HTH domain
MTLREIRFIRGITQQILSVKSGVNQATISHIERGLRYPTDQQKKRIAKVLQLNPKAITWEMNI